MKKQCKFLSFISLGNRLKKKNIPHTAKLRNIRNIDLNFSFLAKEYIRYFTAEPDKCRQARALLTKGKKDSKVIYYLLKAVVEDREQ